MKRAAALVLGLLCVGSVVAQTVKFVGRDAGDGKMLAYMSQVKVLFERAHPGTTVELAPVESTEQEYSNKSVLMMRTDSTADVFIIDSFILPSFVAAGYVAPLAAETWPDWHTQYSDAVKKGTTIDGRVYAIPLSTDTRGLFYNLAVFRKAGLPAPWAPKSWADVIDAARKLKGKVDYPLWINCSSGQGEATTMQTFEMLLSGTRDWLVKDGKWTVNAKGFADSLGFLEQLYIKDQILDRKRLATMLDANSWQLANQIMGEGKIGIQLDGSWKGTDWVKLPDYKNLIGVAPMPNQAGTGFTSMSGGWTVGVSALSKKHDLAFELAKVAAGFEGDLAWAVANGDMVVREDVAADPGYAGSNSYRSAMSKYIEFTNFRPVNEVYPKVSQQIALAVENVVTGKASAAKAADTYAAQVKRIAGPGFWIDAR
jgi:multiple sugar transport system substrate-binding protein